MRRIVITPAAAKQIDELPKVIRGRVYRSIERLEMWPDVSGAKPLSGRLAGRYRIRTGDYRVLIRVTAESVIIERVGHRDGFYEG